MRRRIMSDILRLKLLDRLLRHPDVLGQVEAALLADVGVLIDFHDGVLEMYSSRGGNFIRTVGPFQDSRSIAGGAADGLNFLRQASENM